MAKVIILKSVNDIAMNAQLKNVVLFGETDIIDDGNNIYIRSGYVESKQIVVFVDRIRKMFSKQKQTHCKGFCPS